MAKKNKSKTAPAPEVKAQEVKTEAAETAAAENKEPDITVKIQFAGNEYDVCEITEKVEKAYSESVKDAVKSVDIYIKPEDKAAYYVVNYDNSGKIDL